MFQELRFWGCWPLASLTVSVVPHLSAALSLSGKMNWFGYEKSGFYWKSWLYCICLIGLFFGKEIFGFSVLCLNPLIKSFLVKNFLDFLW